MNRLFQKKSIRSGTRFILPLMAIMFASITIPADNVSEIQDWQSEEIVRVKLYPGLDTVQPGRELPIVLAVEIEPGWHINSDQPNEELLIASSISVQENEKFILDRVVFPEPRETMTELSDVPVSIFEDEVLISGVIRIAANVSPGTYRVSVEFDYQACNEDSCLAPSSFESVLEIVVGDSSASPKKINQDIFEKLKKHHGL